MYDEELCSVCVNVNASSHDVCMSRNVLDFDCAQVLATQMCMHADMHTETQLKYLYNLCWQIHAEVNACDMRQAGSIYIHAHTLP